MSNKNPLKEPTNSTKKPAPTVPTIAASVPAVLDIPIRMEMGVSKLSKLLNRELCPTFKVLLLVGVSSNMKQQCLV